MRLDLDCSYLWWTINRTPIVDVPRRGMVGWRVNLAVRLPNGATRLYVSP